MSDADRLREHFERGALLRPGAGWPNTVDLARAITRAAGGHTTHPATEGEAAIAEAIGDPAHLVFVVLDGLGMSQLDLLPEDSFTRRHVRRELRAVFPSTTASSLTSLATGEWPARHAVTSWWTHIPQIEAPATILTFITRFGQTPLPRLGVRPEHAYPLTPLADSIERSMVMLSPNHLVRTPYTRYISAGRVRRGYRDVPEAVDRVLRRVREATGPSYTHVYIPDVDRAAHRHGSRHQSVQSALEQADAGLRRLSEGLPGDAALVATADHGHLDMAAGGPLVLKEDEEAAALLRCKPAGDARLMFFHVRDGEGQSFERAFRERFGSRLLLLATDDVAHLELLGPGELSTETRRRIGDYMALATDATVMSYLPSGDDQPELQNVVSHHSGLTP
ncbi:MAG: alkaline phosphatase family protein, partial [Chloroflexota bacterium]